MYCHNCGSQLADDANFCSKCGKPRAVQSEALPAAGPAQAAPEKCEIVAETAGEKWNPMFPADMMQFKAKVTGTDGGAVAGESPKFRVGLSEYYMPNEKNKRHIKALEELAAALAAEGWERAGKGEHWYSWRFRRVSHNGPA